MTKAEQVIQAVVALLQAALPFAEHARNADKPVSIAPGGNVIVRDGDRGDPDVTLGPVSYTYQHEVHVDLAAYASASQTREAVLDAMIATIGSAVEANRTLGGLCEWVEPTTPDLDDIATDGAETARWAEFALTCIYTTTSPLA